MRLQISAFRFQILQGRLQTFAFPLVLFLLLVVPLRAQPPQPDWRALEDEIMRHYQTVLRLDTSNPPGNEHLAVEYLKTVFDAESIPSQVLAGHPEFQSIVLRLPLPQGDYRCQTSLQWPPVAQPEC